MDSPRGRKSSSRNTGCSLEKRTGLSPSPDEEKEEMRLSRADIQAAFDFFDVQKKKELKPRDLKARLSAFYPEMTNKEYKFLLDETATPGSGFTVDTLYRIIDNYQMVQSSSVAGGAQNMHFDPVKEAFRIYDPNGHGVVEVEVLASIMRGIGFGELSKEETDLLIRTADFDRDGKINLDDFRNLLRMSR